MNTTLYLLSRTGWDDVFTVLALAGMILAGASVVTIVLHANRIIHNCYQISFVVLAFALGWCAVYGADQHWQPWPPMVALVSAIDCLMAVRLVSRWLMAVDARRANAYGRKTAENKALAKF